MKKQSTNRTPGGSLPRYHRAVEPPRFVLTPRDVRVLRHVYEMRLLSRQQIQRLEFTPLAVSPCKRRLTYLYHGGLLDRLYLPVSLPQGSARALYCLDRRGAEVLAHAEGLPVGDLDWRRHDNDRDFFFLQHLQDVNDVRISFIEAAAGNGWQLQWVEERALRRDPWKVRIAEGHSGSDVTVIPDGYGEIGRAGEQHAFALELDRGTVEEKRIKQKVRGYGEWNTSGRRRIGSLRVLFVVSGPLASRRLERLKRWTQEAGGRSLFWFCLLERVTTADIMHDPIWEVSGTAGAHRLVETPASIPPFLPARRLPVIG